MSEPIKNKSNVRDFFLSTLAVNNRTSVFVIITLITIMGLLAYNTMPKENFPEIKIPTIYVGTAYPGNAPLDMENLVTRPIEKEVNTITGVKNINSTSLQDYSSIEVEFEFSVEVDKALQDVKDAVDRAQAELPNDLPAEPNVLKIDFGSLPVLNVNLSGTNDLNELKYYAEYLQDEIERLSEISSADISGLQEQEVVIKVDANKLAARKISMYDIETAIGGENLTISGGDLLSDNTRRNVRVVGEFADMDEIKNVIVKSEMGNIVYLKDVAGVEFQYEETSSYSRADKAPVVSLNVVKRNGENLLDAADKVTLILAEAKRSVIPDYMKVELINDTSKQTRNMVANLENSIISGVILVVLVLLFFLGLRNATFVGVAIPLSMLMGFMMLQFSGSTLNTMVLFSLILALGMLVDNGIVVVENIYRLMQEGLSAPQAAKEGAGEVAMPIIASTATTLAAFLPLLFWEDIMGEFMKFLPITLIMVLASSLFVALVVNPVLTSVFMKIDDPNQKTNHLSFLTKILAGFVIASFLYFIGLTKNFAIGNGLGGLLLGLGLIAILTVFVFAIVENVSKKDKKLPIKMIMFSGFGLVVFGGLLMFIAGTENDGLARIYGSLFAITAGFALIQQYIFRPLSQVFLDKVMPLLEKAYESILRLVLRNWLIPVITFGATIALLIFSVILLTNSGMKIETFPTGDPNQIFVYAEYPEGTDIEKTNQMTQDIENIVIDVLEPDSEIVESVLANVGEGAGNPQEGFNTSPTPNKARVSVFFYEYDKRGGKTTGPILKEIQDQLKGFPGATISVEQEQNGPPTGPPVNVEISGDDYETLISLTNDVKSYLENSGVPGVTELKMDIETTKPELILDIDRDKARRFGLSTGMIAGDVRTAIFGKEISTFKQGEDEYPINIRFNDDSRYDLTTILDQKITFRNQSNGRIVQVPISAVASPEYSSTIGSVKRKDLERVVSLSSNLDQGFNGREIVNAYREQMKNYELPQGYSVNFTGEQEEQDASSTFLLKAMFIAVALIFFIIVAQFNSVWIPFIILGSVIFSTIGVFLGYTIFRMDFIVIMTGIGIISLAGIVVNNAIVLIDYTNLVRQRMKTKLGLDDDTRMSAQQVKEAIIQGGATRLRPVLLTAITTVLGLIPLAIGFNIDFIGLLKDFDPNIYLGGENTIFWGPMAWTIIFGLVFATFLTLVVVPVMYYLTDRTLYRLFGKGLNTK